MNSEDVFKSGKIQAFEQGQDTQDFLDIEVKDLQIGFEDLDLGILKKTELPMKMSQLHMKKLQLHENQDQEGKDANKTKEPSKLEIIQKQKNVVK